MIVCAASNNAGKLKELRRILERMGHEVKSLRELGITLDPEETGTTFAENARIKAEAFCKASGLPTVADDSGLCTDALNGAPGVYSARYAGHHGDDDANNAKLLQEMADVPAEQRGAKFVSAVCFMLPDGRALEVEGECPGRIAFSLQNGDYGFGYDPLFIPDEYGAPDGKHPNTPLREPLLSKGVMDGNGVFRLMRYLPTWVGVGSMGRSMIGGTWRREPLSAPVAPISLPVRSQRNITCLSAR